MKSLLFMLAVALGAVGCTSKSTARLNAQNAFLAGQNQVLREQLAQQPAPVSQTESVTVVGPVQNPTVPWVAGLTLAQAVATANYLDSKEPVQVVITRQGESATLDARVLVNGPDVPLESGDVIELKSGDPHP